MNLEDRINEIRKEIVEKTEPLSVFLYGSYDTPEFLSGVSDIEIGVIKRGERPVFKTLKKISKNYSTDNVSFKIYSYHLEDLENQKVDSPFTDSVFIRRLVLTAETIWGEKIIENLSVPSIDLIDAYREACFSTSKALAGLFLLRLDEVKKGCKMGSKACLFATATLEYLIGEFPIGFKSIFENSKKLRLDEKWQKLIDLAYNIRLNRVEPGEKEGFKFIYKTIKYCNQIVEEKIKAELKEGSRILIK